MPSACAAAEMADAAGLQKSIYLAYKSGVKQITIPPGTYKLSAQSSSTQPFLNLWNMHDFEINATGVKIVNTTPNTCTLLFKNCRRVSFRGATLEHDPLPFSQGSVEAIENQGKSIKVRIAKGYPANLDDEKAFPKSFAISFFDKANRGWKHSLAAENGVKSLKKLGPNLFTFELAAPIPKDAEISAGDLFACRGYSVPDVDLDGCANMKLLGVSVHGGSGFCFYDRNGDGGNYYGSCTVTRGDRPPGAVEDPLLASNGDAFNSTNVRRGPTLERCIFEWMDGDGIEIAGYYGLVVEASTNKVIVDFRNGDVFRQMDTVRFLNASGASAGSAKIVAVTPLPRYRSAVKVPSELHQFSDQTKARYFELTMDRSIQAKPGYIMCDADTIGSGYEIRDCSILNNRARGMLLRAAHGLVEGCTVEGCTEGGIVFEPEIAHGNTGDYSRSVIVRNNIIRNVNLWHANEDGALTLAAHYQGRFVPSPGGHRDVTIENNTFENIDGINLLVSSAERVVIENNRFVNAEANAVPATHHTGALPTDVLCFFTECSQINMSKNEVTKPGRFFRELINTSGTVEGTGLGSGTKLDAQ